VIWEGALAGLLKQGSERPEKSRRSTVRLMRKFVQRNLRQRHLGKEQDFCFFSSNGKEKEKMSMALLWLSRRYFN